MKNIIILLFSVAAISCGGGGGGGESASTPTTDPDTTFVFSELNTIPNVGDTETINLTGNVDGSGEAVSMSLRIKNSGTTTYNGVTVDVQDVFGNVKIPAFSIDISSIFTYYYDDGAFVRSYDNDSGKICLASGSVNPPPKEVKVGDFGKTIPESCSDGSTSSGTWSVEGVDATHANIIFTETERDSLGEISSISTATIKIDTAGNASDISMKVTYYTAGAKDFSISLSGSI